MSVKHFSLVKAIAAAGLLLVLAGQAHAQQKLWYRYVNDEGVKVLDHSIPPRYAQKGYEVLNDSGQVIRVVPPAPSEDEIAAANARRELMERYQELRRRYSSTEEIEAAKERKLSSIETSISIIRSNISSLTTQMENLMGQAATAERAGQSVPAHVLQSIKDTRAELQVAEELLKIRQEERANTVEKFDNDILVFVKGESLIAKQSGE